MSDLEEFDRETIRIAKMRSEELTLYLARRGVSPEDSRRDAVEALAAVRSEERCDWLEAAEALMVPLE